MHWAKKKTGPKPGPKPGKTGKNREKPGVPGAAQKTGKPGNREKPGKTGKNREYRAQDGKNREQPGSVVFNTHIPVLWPAVGCVFVALVRASCAQTGEQAGRS